MRKNYVLIDFENVQPESLAPLAGEHFKVMVFVGAKQSRVPYEVAASIQQLGLRAEYVKISGNRRNALDFHIAYYLGKLAASEASSYFHIISKDSGYDPLIQHLKAQGVHIGRVNSVAKIPAVQAAAAKSPTERSDLALDWLRRVKASRPRTVKTLCSAIGSLFQKQLSAEEVMTIVQKLHRQGHLTIVGPKVTYRTDGDGSS